MARKISKHQFRAKNIVVTLYNTVRELRVSDIAARYGVPRSTINYLLMPGHFPQELLASQIIKKSPQLAGGVHTDREYIRKRRHAKEGGTKKALTEEEFNEMMNRR